MEEKQSFLGNSDIKQLISAKYEVDGEHISGLEAKSDCEQLKYEKVVGRGKQTAAYVESKYGGCRISDTGYITSVEVETVKTIITQKQKIFASDQATVPQKPRTKRSKRLLNSLVTIGLIVIFWGFFIDSVKLIYESCGIVFGTMAIIAMAVVVLND